MTPAEFAALGRLAWGAAWQRPMAAAMGVSYHLVASMSIGRVGIPDDAAPKIGRALRKRAKEIAAAAKKLLPDATKTR